MKGRDRIKKRAKRVLLPHSVQFTGGDLQSDIKVTVKHVKVGAAGGKLTVAQPFVQFEASKLIKQSNLIEVKLMSSGSSVWHHKNTTGVQWKYKYAFTHPTLSIILSSV